MTADALEHAAIARQALQAGQLRHAGEHVARGLAHAVNDVELLDLFDEIYDRSADPLTDTYPLAQDTSAADAAAHARALARADRHDDAYLLLSQVAQVSPTPFFDWAHAWPIPSTEVLTTCLGRLMDKGLPQPLRAAQHSFVVRAVESRPNDGELAARASVLARRGGDLATSMRWAQRAVATDDSRLALNALARSCLESGDWQGACDAWQRATSNEPDDPYLWLDWGDATLDRGEYDDASERYWQALTRDADNQWAHGSLAYIQYLRSKTARAWTELRTWVKDNPENQRAAQVLRHATPWDGWLPRPEEALFNGFVQMHNQGASLDGANITLSHLEGPSVLHAIRVHTPGFGHTFQEIQSPDPRTPLFEGATPLWTWSEQTPSPTLPPAPAHIQRHVEALALSRFDAKEWLTRARPVAAGFVAADAIHLLSCVVHPTPPPADIAPPGIDDLSWFWRVQHAAAFLLASFPIVMPESPNVQALDAMLAVRNDWNTMAALSAMIAIGEERTELRNHAWGRCYQILQDHPDGGDFRVGDAAYWGLLRLDPQDLAGITDQACSWIDKT